LFNIPPQTFLNDPKIALFCVILVDIWKSAGLDTVILLAGIDEIPDDYYEASIIDGASQIQQFFKITIPLLRPQIYFLLIIKSIYALKTFVIVFMMTPEPKGGPMYSTQVLGLHLYQQTFLGQKFSYGSVVALIIFMMLLFFVIMQIRFFRSKI
jgi:ABC-type sugar transport system permease subunit